MKLHSILLAVGWMVVCGCATQSTNLHEDFRKEQSVYATKYREAPSKAAAIGLMQNYLVMVDDYQQRGLTGVRFDFARALAETRMAILYGEVGDRQQAQLHMGRAMAYLQLDPAAREYDADKLKAYVLQFDEGLAPAWKTTARQQPVPPAHTSAPTNETLTAVATTGRSDRERYFERGIAPLYANAKFVLVATVTGFNSPPRDNVVGVLTERFDCDVRDVIKGTVTTNQMIITRNRVGDCPPLQLEKGHDYVFFLSDGFLTYDPWFSVQPKSETMVATLRSLSAKDQAPHTAQPTDGPNHSRVPVSP